MFTDEYQEKILSQLEQINANLILLIEEEKRTRMIDLGGLPYKITADVSIPFEIEKSKD